MLDFDLSGKHAVITGGGGAIGGATARAMAELGAAVTVLDRDHECALATAADINGAGGRATARQVDVADVADVRDAFGSLEAPLDILVTTAGVISYASILEESEEGFERMVAVNLRGTYFCVQEAASRMAERGSGSIVNLASTAAFVAARVPAAAYSMTKAGIKQLTTASAIELAPLGVRINAVAPATIETPFVKGTLDTPEQRAATVARSPLGRIGQPEDVVGAIVFLASPLAGFITGQTLVVDGGRLCRAG
jgi:meso-butanediol dehydrogenase/(S,S)-butanediol dehydrogenase/diacetyl reductase